MPKNTHQITKKKFVSARLSTKIAISLGGVLVICLVCLSSITIYMTSQSITQTIHGEFSQIASKNGLMVQAIIEDAASVAQDIQQYFLRSYETSEMQKSGKALSETDKKRNSFRWESKVYPVEITNLSYDVENYFLSTAWSVVENNPNIRAVSGMFQPYQFDMSIKDYTLHITEEDAGKQTAQTLGTYEEYCQEAYYYAAAQTKEPVFTMPYDRQGTMILTAAYPVIYDGKLKGVVSVDINVDNFNKIKTTDEKYPTMYVDVFDSDGTIIYDSESPDYINTEVSEYVTEEEYSQMLDLMGEGESFSLATKKDSGEKVVRYFSPIQAAGETWWACSALEKNDLYKSVSSLTFWLILLSTFILILLIVFTIQLLHKMLQPIQGVVEAAKKIAEGNLEVSLKVQSEDEIGILANAFSEMSQNLRGIIQDIHYLLGEMSEGRFDVESNNREHYIGDYTPIIVAIEHITESLSRTLQKINSSTDQVMAASVQMEHAAGNLAEGATDQASSVEELLATIEVVSGDIEMSAKGAESASDKAHAVGKKADNTRTQMDALTKAMKTISQSSREIENIITVIEEIATQTNLLSLNASIEAARAGEAGKGFAVVASEIGKLANDSAKAVKDTKELIQTALTEIEKGNAITKQTANVLFEVVEGIETVAGMTEEVKVSSLQQAQSIRNINQGVEQISLVVQNNSATAQETAATSEELSHHAESLEKLVKGFQFFSV